MMIVVSIKYFIIATELSLLLGLFSESTKKYVYLKKKNKADRNDISN